VFEGYHSLSRVAVTYYLKCPIFTKKISRHAKKQENLSHTQKTKQETENACEKDQMSDLTKYSKQPL